MTDNNRRNILKNSKLDQTLLFESAAQNMGEAPPAPIKIKGMETLEYSSDKNDKEKEAI